MGETEREGNGAPPGFDADLYLASNPDLRAAFEHGLIASAAAHWRESGDAETRAGTRPTCLERPDLPREEREADGVVPGFDAASYLLLNPDLASSIGRDPAAALGHWTHFGAVEGRPCFGAPAPWDRALGTRAVRPPSPAVGCDVFVAADPFAGEEAALGRRVLEALRAAGVAVTIWPFARRDGALALDEDVRDGLDHPATLLVASAGTCRLLLDRLGPDRLGGRTVLAFLPAAPLRRHMPDWLLLSSLDAVLVADGTEAALLRAVSPVPVHEIPVQAAARLPSRRDARRALGLSPRDRVTVREERPSATGLGLALFVDGDGQAGGRLSRDDVPDPWTGASRLLAAADRFAPGRRGRATVRADAAAAGLAPLPAPPDAAGMGRALRAILALPPAPRRGAARLGVPALPSWTLPPGSGPLPVLSVLAGDTALGALLLDALLGGEWGYFELCVAVAGRDGVAGRRLREQARGDPRIRPIARGEERSGLAAASDVATGTHLVPVFGADAIEAVLARLGALASVLAVPDAPALLVEALDEGEWEAARCDAPCGPLSLRDRLETEVTSPVAVSREAFERVGGRALLGGADDDRGWALTLALLRDGVVLRAVPPSVGSAPPVGPGAERALRRHVAGAGIVEPGWIDGTFRIRRFSTASPSAFDILPIGAGSDLVATVAACRSEHVLLVGTPVERPDPASIAALAELLADPGVGGVCPVVLDAEGLIAEAGLTVDGHRLRAGLEVGWPLSDVGPGRAALRVRNVHAASVCLATRRSALLEAFGRSMPRVTDAGPVAEAALMLGRAGLRIVATPFATVRRGTVFHGADCSCPPARAEEAGDGWPSG